jgi:ATP-binding cassette, subfamily B, bacterial
MGFPYYQQPDQMDCGPACLRMVAKHYGRNYPLLELRNKAFLTREGVSLLGISDAAEAIGGISKGIDQKERRKKFFPFFLPFQYH